MPSINLTDEDKARLKELALKSIQYGVEHHQVMPVNTSDYDEALQQQAATFVTLDKHDMLRGCIGTLEAHQPLVNDVVEHAYAAAFQDPRFPAVHANEVPELQIEISILTHPEPLQFSSQQDLINQIRPGIDGLILEHGFNRGTFLPSVWEQLPGVEDFFTHLKAKAGLPASWWSDDAKVSRYETIKF